MQQPKPIKEMSVCEMIERGIPLEANEPIDTILDAPIDLMIMQEYEEEHWGDYAIFGLWDKIDWSCFSEYFDELIADGWAVTEIGLQHKCVELSNGKIVIVIDEPTPEVNMIMYLYPEREEIKSRINIPHCGFAQDVIALWIAEHKTKEQWIKNRLSDSRYPPTL